VELRVGAAIAARRRYALYILLANKITEAADALYESNRLPYCRLAPHSNALQMHPRITSRAHAYRNTT